MAFADPQSVTVNAVAQTLPRIESKGTSSRYRKSDGTFELSISHQLITDARKGRRVRSTAAIVQTAIVPDPLTSVNDFEELMFRVIVDRPEAGFTQLQTEQLVNGFCTWLQANSNAAIIKLFSMES